MKTPGMMRLVVLITLFLSLNHNANSANVNWLSAVSGNWNDGTKWSGGSAPGVNDTAVITVAGTYTVTLDINASVAKLVLGNASGFQLLTASNRTISIANASTINPHGTLELYQSSLNGAGSLTANGKLRLIYNNSVACPLILNDTLHITHQTNTINGTFTTSATAVILMDASASHSMVTFANGFTNNGKIQMQSATCNYNYLIVTSGVLTNAASASIVSDPNPYCVGYNRIDGRINNLGTITVNHTLRHYSTAAGSDQTGTISIASGMQYLVSSGVFNWNGGTATGNGALAFENATGNFNTVTMPSVQTSFYQSTFGSSSGTSNVKKVTLVYNNTVTANFNNTDTLYVTHQSNFINGNYTCTSSSVIYMDASQSHSIVTFASGFTNNGKINMTSATCNYNYLIVTSGVLTNAASATIVSNPNPYCVGYNRIDGRINNLGTITVNYSLRHYSAAAGSDQTGTIHIASGMQYIVSAGVFNWNGGTVTGTGILAFENATGNFNVANMPNIETSFYQSTLGSTFLPTTSSRVINLVYNNSITAAIFNMDTIKVHHQNNIMSGALTTATTSVILFDASQSHSILTVNSGFTNNGKIKFESATCNYGYLAVSSGVLINSPSGIIQSDPNPYCTGYHRLDAALNNQGTVNINYTLRHYTNTGASNNTGNISFTNGYNLEVYNGTWNWNGGSVGSPGVSKILFSGAIASWNTATMPAVVTYYYQSTLASSLSGVSNSKKIQLSYTNNINANLNNTDTIEVMHQNNVFSGNYTNTTSAMLLFDAVESHSILGFNNSFINNGKIKFISATCNYGYLYMNNGTTLTNAATGIIQSDPNPYCTAYHRMDAALINQGTLNVNYTLRHYTNPGTSTNTGTINFTNGYNLEVYNGTWNWNGGSVGSPGVSKILFSGAIASWNTATMPAVVTYYYQSTLASSLSGISNSKKIQLSYTNNITANLNNTDTIEVVHQNNVFSGNYTNTTAAMLLFDAVESHSILGFNNSFINNGKIKFTSATCNYGYLYMNNGTTLTNAATGIIQSDPNPYCIAYHRMDAALINQGTVNVNYTLRHYTNPGTSINTGVINFTNGYNLEVYNGTWNWNGGSIGTPGQSRILFSGATANFNTTTMPAVVTYYYQSTLATSLSGISNSKKVQLSYNDNVTANLNNTDTIEVVHQNNIFSGNYTNTVSSVLLFDALESHSVLTFNNSFANNGTIRMLSNTCNYGYLYMNPGTTLTNAASGFFISDPNPYCIGYHRLDGNYINNGTTAINYQLNHYNGSFTNNGTLKGGAFLNNQGTLLTNNGTIAPGSSPGKLSINANLSNKSTSIWNIEIGGLTVATQHDQVDNNYASTKDSIDGTLNISLINGFVPSLGDSVVIETHNLRTGTFATITGQSIPGGLFWNVFYRTNHIALRAGNPPNLDIVSSTGANGTISPLGTTSVVYNGTQTYNMIPNTNYHVLDVLVDGASVGAVTSYTFNNVIVNHTISVTFAINTWNIVATTSGNGNISPSGTVVINQGNNQTFTITANPCNLIDSVIVDGVYQGAVGSYTFNNIIANHTIKAVFRIAPRITASGPTTFCTGGNVILDAGSGYSNYNWSNGASTQTANITTGGTYTCTITSTGGCTSSTSVVVTVNPLPSVSFTNPFSANSGHTCFTNGSAALNGFGSPAGGGFSGAGVSNLFGNYSFSPSTAGVGGYTLTYTYTDGNGCSNSATTSVAVDQNATVNAGADIILCNNPLANLSGVMGGSASSSTWSSNGTGSFGNANSLSTTYTLSSADMTAGTVTLTLTTDDPSNTCGAVNDQLVITYNPDAVADAGPSIACVTAPVSLSGSIAGYPATPHWTTSGTGNFSNANSLNTIYNPSVADITAGHVYLILTPIDPLGNCTFTADSMDTWFNPYYTVNAGSDVVLCGINDTIATLSGSFTNASSVTWSGGSGTFGNANAAGTTYVLSAAERLSGLVSLTLTTNDPAGPCTSVSDNMVIKYKYATAEAGADVCGDTITSLSGYAIANALASSSLNYLWATTGSGNFSTPGSSSTTYHASNADLTSGQTKIYFNLIDGTGDCTYAKDSMTIWYNPHYSVDAGADSAEVCANAILTVSGSKINALGTTWTTSGSGTFGNANLLSTTYTPSNADTTAGWVILTLVSNDPAGPCVSVSDQIYIAIHSAPDASAGNNTPICNGTDLNLTASGGTSYSWTGPNSFTSLQQNIIIPNSTVAMSGTYNVMVTNDFGCSNPASTVVIVNPCGCIAPSLLESHINVSCYGGNSGSIDITAVGGSGGNAFLWSNNATTEDISGLTAGTYTVTVTVAGGCTVTLSVTITQPISPLPPIGITPNGPTTFCTGGNVILDADAGYTSWLWSTGSTSQSLTVSTSGSYSVTATNGSGCTAASAAPVVVTVETGPPSGSIHSPLNTPLYACTGDILVSSCNTVPGASVYTWDAPSGTTFDGTINNPYTTTNTIVNVHYGQPNGTGYYICVQASNSCGATNRKCGWVRGTVSGPDPIVAANNRFVECANTSATYSTNAIGGATSYTWTITGNATVINNGTSATVNFLPGWTGGTLCVNGNTPCTSGPARCVQLSNATAAPGVLSGPSVVCPNSNATYSIPVSSGAATYNWMLPANTSGSSSSNSINIHFNSGYTLGNVRVNITSICGVASSTMVKTVSVGLPASPATINSANGAYGFCNQSAVFSCTAVAGATGYTWTAPSGTINSGQNTTSTNISFGSFSNSNVCVTADNSCGSSAPRCISVNGKPGTPAPIVVNPSAVCANQSGVELSVSPVYGTIGYTWSFPAGVGSVLDNGNQQIVNWGPNGGTVMVTVANACGNSTRSQNIALNCREIVTENIAITKNKFSVYPNPAHTVIKVAFYAESKSSYVLSLKDLSGREVYNSKAEATEGNNEISMDLSSLAKGIYMVELNSGSVNDKVRIILQ